MAIQNGNIQVQRNRLHEPMARSQREVKQAETDSLANSSPRMEGASAISTGYAKQAKVSVTKQTGDAQDSMTNRRDLGRAVNLLHRIRPGLTARYEIRINHDYDKLQLHLVDRKSGEVVQKIPSNHLLAFYDNIEKMTGFLFEEKV